MVGAPAGGRVTQIKVSREGERSSFPAQKAITRG
jgi:hypothetical protein